MGSAPRVRAQSTANICHPCFSDPREGGFPIFSRKSVRKSSGGACANARHRVSASLRRGGATPGVVSSAACAVTLARSSFRTRAFPCSARRRTLSTVNRRCRSRIFPEKSPTTSRLPTKTEHDRKRRNDAKERRRTTKQNERNRDCRQCARSEGARLNAEMGRAEIRRKKSDERGQSARSERAVV